MSGEQPVLEGVRLCRTSRDGRALLEEASLALHAGEVVTLSGSSGSGKTVLLRALALLDPLDSGRVLFAGREPGENEIPGFRRRVAYVHQRPVLVPGSVERNLRLPAELKTAAGHSFSRSEAVDLLSKLGRSEELLGARTADLSGGEGQIVALVRILLASPRVLLLDEPSASLDPRAAAALEDLIVGWVRSEGGSRAALWVTHAEDQAERVSSRRLRFEEGAIVEASSVEGSRAP